MKELLSKIRNKIAVVPLQEAIDKAVEALPSNSDLIALKAQSLWLENQHQLRLIEDERYEVSLVKKLKSLYFFIDRLGERDIEKLHNTLFEENSETLNKSNSILFVSSIPKNQDYLQSDFEYGLIKNAIAKSKYRHNFNLELPILASTIDELTIGINVIKPLILHFSGHAGKKGIILSDPANDAEIIPTNILNDFFSTFDKTIKCVVLNACYSAVQAKVISKYVLYVIGMNCPVGDDAAIVFSEAFYNYICNDEEMNFEKAFKQAKIKLQLKHPEESNSPEIWKEEYRIEM